MDDTFAWQQANVAFPDWDHAEDVAAARIAPRLDADGLVSAWWFIRKHPCWRIRYQPAVPEATASVERHLDELAAAGHITGWTRVVYEPEVHAFGGPEAMAAAHRLFHLDSRALLAYLRDQPGGRHRREISLMLCSVMMRAARQDWFEQGDTWARVADRRKPPPGTALAGPGLPAAVRHFLTTDAESQMRDGAPLGHCARWAPSWADTGRELSRPRRGRTDAPGPARRPSPSGDLRLEPAGPFLRDAVRPRGHREDRRVRPGPRHGRSRMSTTMTADIGWFPLVPRPRPPGLPLHQRVAELTAMASRADKGTCQQQATRAAAVLNNAALIASDCGVPALAREQCHRQYELLTRSAPLPSWAVRLALQTVLNIPRQLIRDGRGDTAHAILNALHQAAAERTAAAVIDGTKVDFATLTGAADAHKEALTLTWTALLADGTRALAQAGRWKEAASHAAANRGTGTRLLDGRQAAILALLTDGQPARAALLVEQTTLTEPWEHAVQAVLRVLCQHTAGQVPEPSTASMTAIVLALVQEPDPATTVTRTRIGLTALDLADGSDTTHARALSTALLTAASTDAYAARDLLASPHASRFLTPREGYGLQAIVRASGLGAGMIPAHLHAQMASAVRHAEDVLARTEISDAKAEKDDEPWKP